MRTNKTQAKKLLLLCLAILIPLLVNGETVCINGIYYNLISKVKQAEVIQGDAWYSGNKTIPPSVTYNDTEYIVTSIGNVAFYKCWDLTSISIPETVTNIGVNAFNGCSNLKSIDLPSGLTNLGSSALGYTGITSVIIPDGVKTIEDHVFAGCSRLNSITFSDSITAIGNYAFLDCCNLNNVSIPSSIKSIGDGAFSGCSSLTSIILPNGITKIKDSAFYNCSGLTSITIPEGVISVGYCALAGCSRLTTIIIPNGLTTIEWYAFASCTNLKEVFLPESIVTIEEKSFKNCSNLEDVYCYAKNIPSTESDAFDGSFPEYATLHVPANALENYKMTSPWSSFGTFEVLEIVIEDIILNQTTGTLTEGETLTLYATINPEDANNPSLTWSSSDPSVATVDNTGKVTAIAPGTATITAKANDSSGVSASCEVTVTPASYVITYLIDGEVFLTDTLTRGSAISLPEEPTKEGYTFSGWGEVPEVMPAKDMTIEGSFIVNKYLVTFKIGDEVIASDSLEYGANIVVPEAPEKEGYTFNGWGKVVETVPASDVTYGGSYTINTYKVYYYVDEELVHTAEVTYGEPIPEYIYEPTAEGDEFLGWIGETYATMPAHDVTYTANIESGINQITIDNGYPNIYDLTGRKVNIDDLEELSEGIYIINGRKVVVKIGM